MSYRMLFEYENPTPVLLPRITRSRNQSSSAEFYNNPPQTLPDPRRPMTPQFDNFLYEHSLSPKHYGDPQYGGPYGRLGVTEDPDVVEMKGYLAELPPTVSLEARGVFLTTLLNKFHPSALFSRNNTPPMYDHQRDLHLAQDIYGGNGLYTAAEEWVALAKGKFPGIREPVKLPWLAMHMRHTILKSPQLIQTHEQIQTAIDLIKFFQRHFRKPHEDEGAYVDRMAEEYWRAHLQLHLLHLLPREQKVPAESVAHL